jgi:hypothetical protein
MGIDDEDGGATRDGNGPDASRGPAGVEKTERRRPAACNQCVASLLPGPTDP